MMRLMVCAFNDRHVYEVKSHLLIQQLYWCIFLWECGVSIWTPADPLGANPVDDAYNGRVIEVTVPAEQLPRAFFLLLNSPRH